ncbi:MAG: WD40 repeat domain-containing serine/threonine protein kinase [Actinomadura sp.]
MGPYRLEAVLGEGGMGRVYVGRTPAGSAVAVKLVHRAYAADPAFRRRFEQEVATARRVQGLYTVPVVDADVQADEPWLATAYIPGPSLQHAVAEHGPLPVDATLSLIARVAEALQSIHAADVIHRDLKPSNVILTAEGPKVIDFGIARAADLTSITGTGVQPGTPAYMAPEHIRGQALTPAADVFALGVVANFAATGELAFGGGSAPAVIHRIVAQEPDLDGCAEPIRTIAAACLSKDPRQRPTPAEVIRQCHQAGTGMTERDAHTASLRPAAPSASPGPGTNTPPATPTEHDTGRPIAPAPPAVPPRTAQPRDAPTEVGPRPLTRRSRRNAGLAIGAVLAAVVLVVPWNTLNDDPERPSTSSQRAPAPPTPSLAATLSDGNNVADVAFSPDGKLLAASVFDDTSDARDGEVKLWDMAGRRQVATLSDQAKSISQVAFGPDGKLLATTSDDDTVRLWDVAGQRQVATLRGHTHTLTSVAFSPDGRTLASASEDDTVRLWNVTDHRPIATFTHPKGLYESVASVVFSPDGRTLATGNADGTVRLWNVAERRQAATLRGHTEAVRAVVFSPDGRFLASAGSDNTSRLWDVAKRQEVATLRGHDDHNLFPAVAFSPDGRTLAYNSQDDSAAITVKLWNLPSRRPIATLTTEAYSLAFSPDSRTLATNIRSSVNLWDIG